MKADRRLCHAFSVHIPSLTSCLLTFPLNFGYGSNIPTGFQQCLFPVAGTPDFLLAQFMSIQDKRRMQDSKKKNKMGIGSCRPIHLLLLAISSAVMLAACATPKIQVADAQSLLNSELAFIKDGETTREEIALKLGVPSAQLEGDRILMYQFRAGEDGKWNLVSPIFSGNLRGWGRGTSSLVLVFGPWGILQKHSFVISK